MRQKGTLWSDNFVCFHKESVLKKTIVLYPNTFDKWNGSEFKNFLFCFSIFKKVLLMINRALLGGGPPPGVPVLQKSEKVKKNQERVNVSHVHTHLKQGVAEGVPQRNRSVTVGGKK